MVLCGLFAAVIAVCSWISIPTAVPFTLQTFAVFCTLGILGGRLGTTAIFLYILIGMAGLPVFSGFNGGFGALLGATGGYIIGFVFTGLIYLAVTKIFGEKPAVMAVAMLSGLAACYLVGTLWYVLVYSKDSDFLSAAAICIAPFVIPDLVKLALAVLVTKKVSALIPVKRYRG